MKKRPFWIIGILAVIPWVMGMTPAFGAGNDIFLGLPQLQSKTDLIALLNQRESAHAFLNKEISIQDLGTVLWAANGTNRDNGKRTAPSAYGKYFIEIYVASDQGVYLYQPEQKNLKYLSDKKIKSQLAGQGDIKTASHVLILTAKLNLFPFFVAKNDRIEMAHATAGCIGENIYLMAAALGLGTRFVGDINETEIRNGIALAKDEIPLYVMPLGYPKK